jgi:hypothetical protein
MNTPPNIGNWTNRGGRRGKFWRAAAKAEFITPIPKPKKRKADKGQVQMFTEDKPRAFLRTATVRSHAHHQPVAQPRRLLAQALKPRRLVGDTGNRPPAPILASMAHARFSARSKPLYGPPKWPQSWARPGPCFLTLSPVPTKVFDLSATLFFLRSPGYAEGTLFPWAMSDF